jgi:threonine synthase
MQCVLCGREFAPGDVRYTCPDCGLDGTLDVLYDYDEVRKHMNRNSLASDGTRSLWRYRAVLPVEDESHMPPLSVGWTPLYEAPALERAYGIRKVFVKDDGRNPTASLKDRASAIGVAKALDAGQTVVACASTGNAASSLSGFAAVSGLASVIFVPQTAPAAKVTQLLVYGATVVLVRGDYSDAFLLATAAIDAYGWYNRNCAINPYLVEGKKTCAMEIAEQLNFEVPDRVFISVGDGCCIGGLHKGFLDLMRLGLIDRMPKITGVQAEGARPIHDAVESGSGRVTFGPADTVADSISVGAPRNWAKALRAVRTSGGTTVAVSDAEILSAIPELARSVGVFGEPAGAAAFAGFRKMAAEGRLAADESVAIVVTGNGLKDIESARKSVGSPIVADPDLDDFRSKARGVVSYVW